MNKYERLKNELTTIGNGKMKAFGNSMLPILKSGSLLSFKACSSYHTGDIVFCKVKGRYIDAHKIVKEDTNKGFLIANNHGFENGWTKVIYGKVTEAVFRDKIIYRIDN
jgi:SOS-response transcriptional repressor LexA